MTRIVVMLAGMATLFACGDAYGQRRVPGFVNRPTLSPYINMFGNNQGGLNNYLSIVRPQLRAEQFIQESTQQTQINRMLIRQEETNLRRTLELISDPTGSPLQQRPTSNSGGVRRPSGRFMSFGSFYPSRSGNQVRR